MHLLKIYFIERQKSYNWYHKINLSHCVLLTVRKIILSRKSKILYIIKNNSDFLFTIVSEIIYVTKTFEVIHNVKYRFYYPSPN